MKKLLSLAAVFLALSASLYAQGGCGGVIEQGTAYEVKIGPFLTTANSSLNALVIPRAAVLLAKGAGDWTQKNETTSATHEGFGWYSTPIDATDTGTIGNLMLKVDTTGTAIPVWCSWTVMATGSFEAYEEANLTTAGAVADAVLDEAVSGHSTVGTLGQHFQNINGTADSGTTTTIVDAARTEATTDSFKGSLIRFTSGTNTTESRLITAFTPASDTITFSPALPAAASTENYIIEPFGRTTQSAMVPYGLAFPNFPIWMKNSSNAGVTGLTNIVCKITQDGAAAATTNDTTEAEPDAGDNPGLYLIDLAATETDNAVFMITCTDTVSTEEMQFDTFATPQR